MDIGNRTICSKTAQVEFVLRILWELGTSKGMMGFVLFGS